MTATGTSEAQSPGNTRSSTAGVAVGAGDCAGLLELGPGAGLDDGPGAVTQAESVDSRSTGTNKRGNRNRCSTSWILRSTMASLLHHPPGTRNRISKFFSVAAAIAESRARRSTAPAPDAWAGTAGCARQGHSRCRSPRQSRPRGRPRARPRRPQTRGTPPTKTPSRHLRHSPAACDRSHATSSDLPHN